MNFIEKALDELNNLENEFIAESRERFLWRGEELSREKTRGLNSFGLFFSTTRSEAKNFSDTQEPVRYRLSDNARIFECRSSYDFMADNSLEGKSYPRLAKLLQSTYMRENGENYPYKHIRSYADWESAMIDDGIEDYEGEPYFEYWFIPQYIAYTELKDMYDGIRYTNEDGYSPVQYQIWNLGVVEKSDK